MFCDGEGCQNRSQLHARRPTLLSIAEAGWFVAEKCGDRCPECVAAGLMSRTAVPSIVMHRIIQHHGVTAIGGE
jgi:hypothetical protein